MARNEAKVNERNQWLAANAIHVIRTIVETNGNAKLVFAPYSPEVKAMIEAGLTDAEKIAVGLMTKRQRVGVEVALRQRAKNREMRRWGLQHNPFSMMKGDSAEALSAYAKLA